MSLPMFPKRRAHWKNESPKYMNCVDRFMIARTTNLDNGKCHRFLGVVQILFKNFLPTDQSNFYCQKSNKHRI